MAADAAPSSTADSNLRIRGWIVVGVALAALHVLLASVASLSAESSADARLTSLATVYALTGAVYLIAIVKLAHTASTRALIAWILLAGLVMRVPACTQPFAFETDFHRYLWEGALFANGFDPYSIRPLDALIGNHAALPNDPKFAELARAGAPTLSGINHPHLTSTYPLVSQALFAFAYLISPFSENALRGLYLLSELLTVAVLAASIIRTGKSLTWLAVYWWNPIVIKELYLAGHMDSWVGLLVALSVFLTVKRARLASMLALGLAIGVKLWPVVLAPFLIRYLARRRLVMLRDALLLGAITLALTWPMVEVAFRERHSGLGGYVQHWVNNSGVFALLLWIAEVLSKAGLMGPFDAHRCVRIFIGSVFALWLVQLLRRRADEPERLFHVLTLALGGLYLLSPTQFPWYYIWLLPALTLSPTWPLLLYSALLPLYHVKHLSPTIAWIQHSPVWIAVGVSALRGRSDVAARSTRFFSKVRRFACGPCRRGDHC
ncbi:MAG: glycosyltransferase family 87 protein [Planctomycetota bacterium]